jgi:hypothetical protein
MQNQNWRFLSRVIAVAVVTLLVVSFTTLAVAQSIAAEDRDAIFAAAPKTATSVKGASVFAAPPSNFDPLTASNRELLSWGLPQRPDKASKAYEHWERGMLAMKAATSSGGAGRTTSSKNVLRVTDVQAQPFTSREMMPVGKMPSESPAISAVPTQVTSYNWSGIAQTNTNTRWNNRSSFTSVDSVFNVPVSDHPFGNVPCANGPWYEVSWNGIDGAKNGDVVQGGSYDYWYGGGCGGAIAYYGWVEWYPSYSILVLYCGANPCPVSPGDDFWVITYGAPGFSNQNVFVEDISQQWSGTINLAWLSGPGLVGSSAEYIVERPCCTGGGFNLPLNNYVYDFFDYSFAYNGAGIQSFPGSGSPSTWIFTMYADDGVTPISVPTGYGSSGYQGKYSIWFADENCAYSGSCTI